MRGAIPPFHNMPLWHGAQLKNKESFTLPVPLPKTIQSALLRCKHKSIVAKLFMLHRIRNYFVIYSSVEKYFK
jgi:hypothetical protein